MKYFRKIFKLPKRFLILGLLILIVLSFFYFRSQSNKQPKLQFTQVKKQNIKSIVSSSGNLTGKDTVNLKFKTSGKLAYINVKVGDNVSAFQTIAGLDTQDLNIKLQQAQNTLRDKQAAVEKTLDDVKDHSKDETFTQKKDRTAAEVARDNAFDSVKEAQRAFGDAVIVTPISGLVTQVPLIVEQTVTGADLVAQVVDTSAVIFETEIDEVDIVKVIVGQSAEVTLDAYPNQLLRGLVDQIQPLTKATSSGGTVISVRIKLDNPKITFVNGLSGQASIIIAEAENALTIPQEALRDDNTVFIQKGQSLKPSQVTPGIKSDTDVEVKDGLVESDQVLLNPPSSGTRINQNRNPIQGIIFRVFGGGRGGIRR